MRQLAERKKNKQFELVWMSGEMQSTQVYQIFRRELELELIRKCPKYRKRAERLKGQVAEDC